MAIVNSILLGRAKGSIGNVSFSTQKGRVIARQKPTIVSNPRTQAQLDQRAKVSAVNVAWFMVGQAIKSGITQLVGLGSQFNTYVSKNADIFAGKAFTKETFKTSDLVGSYASIGAMPELPYELADDNDIAVVLSLDKNALNMYAKEGDILKLVAGKADNNSQLYGEVVVTQALLNTAEPVAVFDGVDLSGGGANVMALWLESNDGRTSSTSTFQIK